MNRERSHPPAVAMWLLRHLIPRRNREALAGDLVESFSQRHSPSWFWRQVLIAILVGASRELSSRWPQICFAAAGTALLRFHLTRISIWRMLAIEPCGVGHGSTVACVVSL